MRSKWKRYMKRLIALILTVALVTPILSSALVAKAETTYEAVTVYDLERMQEQLLESDEAEALTGSAITFPVTAAVMNVGTELVFHVFRQGSTEKKETITLGTYDMTAGYGEDYEIYVNGEAVEGKANKMLDGKDTVYDVYLGENVLEQSEEAEDVTQEEVDAQAEQIKQMTSSTFDVTFEKGETTKEIHIRGFVPKKATGNKEFQIMVMEYEDGMTLGTNGTAAITLEDKRETEETEIQIVKNSAKVVDGYVTVTVERSGNTESYATYNLNAENGTAENGIDYVMNAAQLTFTPGVTKQRVHIPLVSSSVQEEKSFTLKTDDSEEVVTYTTTNVGATFKQSRDKIDIPMSEFIRAGKTASEVDFYYDSDSEDERYIFSFYTKIGDADNRTASIRTSSKYDFTGIERIKMSASYRVGTIIGDHLNVYASDTDYYNDLGSLATLEANKYGRRIDTIALTGKGIENIYVDRIGEYYLFMTAEQHDCFGYIGYNLYDQEFDGGDSGHVALIKKKYDLELISPRNISQEGTSSAPVGDLSFALMSDEKVNGKNISDVYRDDSFKLSYTALMDDVYFKGYEILDSSDSVIYTRWTDSNVFYLDSEVLKYVEGKSMTSVRVRPIFDRADVSVTISEQEFAEMGLGNLSAQIDMSAKEAVYYDSGVEIATVTWSTSSFKKGDTLKFSVRDNNAYSGEYHFDSFRVRSSYREDLSDSNPLYYSNRNWSTVLERDYYEVVPMFSCAKAPFYLVVSNATHGGFIGKPENLTTDKYTVTEMDGVYETTDIVTLTAKPEKGYRAKWSYLDVASGMEKFFYGNVFYYQVQFPITSTDNYVYLEFEKDTGTAKDYSVLATVYMQGGDVVHQPDPKSTDYSPLGNAQVSIGGIVKETSENGSTGETPFTISGYGGEVHRAMVLANNRYYIHDITLPDSNAQSVNEEIKLSYYYEGPRVTSMKYYDHLGKTQSGDTIYLEDQTDSVIISATIEANNKEVTDVLYTLTDSEGTPKMESIEAEVCGAEYIWSVSLGTLAAEGDQIWIELVNRQTDENGEVKTTSYGKVNTGYSIVIAEFKEVSYIPDTGDTSVDVPFWGNMYFNFSIAGFKPIITTSKSGNIYFLNLGISGGGFKDLTEKKWGYPSWDGFKQNKQKGMAVFSGIKSTAQGGSRDDLKVATQTMKTKMFSINFPVSFQLAFYIGKDPRTLQSAMYFVGGYVSVGLNTSLLFSYPFLIWMVPVFVNVEFTLAFSDMFQFVENTDTGLVEINQLHDPTKTCYKPGNDLNLKFDFILSAGVGVNSVANVSGGGDGAIALDWIDFSYGKGTMWLDLQVRVEVFLIGKTFSYTVLGMELFDHSPYASAQVSETEEASEMEDMLNTKLKELKMKSTDSYQQSVSASLARTGSNTFVTDAYQFSRPKIVSMGNDKYLIVATVDSSHVNGYDQVDKTAVMSYAIFDAATHTFVSGADGKVFTSLEPLQTQVGAPITPGDSLNFNPSVVAVDGGYAVVWNSVEYGTSGTANLTVDKMRTVIKSAVIKDVQQSSGQNVVPIYNSIVVTNDSDDIMPSLVSDIAYDSENKEVILLYRTLNFENLTEESTLGDYLEVGSALSATSLKVSDAALADSDNAWSDPETLVTSDRGSVLKEADIAMMDDDNDDGTAKVPVITYHVTKGRYANLLYEAENEIYEDADSTNHIYLASLKKSGSGYAIKKSAEVPLDTEEYQSNPQLAIGKAGNLKARNLLMWRQKERIAVADPIDVLDGKYADGGIYDVEEREHITAADQTTGLAAINELSAGNNGDFQLIEGEDGRLYCLWTERYSDETTNEAGSVIKMSVLEQDSAGTAYWTESKEICHTIGNQYIQSISAVIDGNGCLRTLFRQTDLSDDNGTSQIQMKMQEDVRSTLLAEESDDISVQGIVYATPELEITDIDYVANNIYDGVNADTYTVDAKVTNTGDAAAEESELVVSYLESNNAADGTDHVDETTLGQVSVPALEPGESATVTFDITVDPSYYSKAYFKIAPIGIALYENYGTDDQNMVDAILDGVQAAQEELADDLEVTTNTVAINEQKVLQTRIYPATAQRFETLTFASSDPSILTVDENGVITGVRRGTASVTVTTASGIEKQVKITVTKDASDDGTGGSTNGSGTNDTAGKNTDKSNGSRSGAKTGDPAGDIMLLIFICIVAAAVVAAIIRRRKDYGF